MGHEEKLNILKSVLAQLRISESGVKSHLEKFINNEERKTAQKEIIRRLRIQCKKLQEQKVLLKDRVKRGDLERALMIERVQYLRKINSSISRALGSCQDCWGGDTSCRTCLGNGNPGWRKINKRLFNLYILPTVKKIYRSGH